jgi:acyl transferase domain-containing protein
MAATADPTSTPGHVTLYTNDRLAALSPLKLALMADQRRAGMALSEAEPIAIVGLGCRFPGAPDPLAFWRLLRDGVESVVTVPADRWDADALYDPNPDRPGHACTKLGSFLQDIDRFDPQFFGIAPREAWQMDPQQRLVLEVVWEALEHAALAPEKLAGTATGLFLGISASDYVHVFLKAQDLDGLTANSGTSGALCVAAGRVSYALGFQGPAVALDTACSSSLVALHLACQSLRRAECDTALAGGVNLILTPLTTVAFSRAHI